MNELPFSKFFYSLNGKIIDYTCEERDLGILVNPKITAKPLLLRLINF